MLATLSPAASSAIYSGASILVRGLIGAGVLGIVSFFIVSVVKACTRRTTGWIVSSVISGVLSLILAVICCISGAAYFIKKGRQARIGRAVAAESASFTPLVSADGLVTIDVPSAWSPEPKPASKAIIQASDKATGESVGVYAYKPQFSLQTRAEALLKSFSTTMTDFESQQEATDPVDGCPAIRYRITGKSRRSVRMVYYLTIVDGATRRYDIFVSGHRGDEETISPLLKRISGSLRVKPGNSPAAEPAPAPEEAPAEIH